MVFPPRGAGRAGSASVVTTGLVGYSPSVPQMLRRRWAHANLGAPVVGYSSTRMPTMVVRSGGRPK